MRGELADEAVLPVRHRRLPQHVRVPPSIEAALDLRVFAGPRDDPFFFDLDGFRETVETGTLAFDNMRDSFAGYDITAVVLEMSIDAVASGSDNVAIWVTTGRM